MITVTLYSRTGCHLCEQVKADLAALQSELPHRLVEVDIESDDALLKAYFEKIPVVQIGPYRRNAPITRTDLEISLRAAADRERHFVKIDTERNAKPRQKAPTFGKVDRFFYWLVRNYIWAVNFLILLYIGIPFLAPVFMHVGWEPPARLIYRAYGNVCHQWAFRSWFLFGAQPVYPRAEAGVDGLQTFATATGLSEGPYNADLNAARAYVGDPVVGYKIALCQRDVATYLAILAFGVLYALTGSRIPALPWYLWILIGLLPIGVDGFSQVLSQPPLNLFAFRESTPLLRTLTGALFGFSTAWFGFPILHETMQESRKYLSTRAAQAGSPQTGARN